MPKFSPTMKQRARQLRGTPTTAEQRLWAHLRGGRLDGWHFRRQHPIPPYVVDFACLPARLVVEANGGQHAESEHDRGRDLYLRRQGWRVLRFWNHDVLANTEGVIATIAAALPESPPPQPSPAAAGEGVDCGRSGPVSAHEEEAP